MSIVSDVFLKKIGRQIKKLRKQKGFSQELLAEKIEMSRNMISLIECGESNTHILTLHKIFKALGKDISKNFTE